METVINVGGTSRSGSTMLHLILGNDERAFACGEAVNWFRPVKTHQFRFECACGRHPCPVWSQLDGVTERSFYRRAFTELDIDLLVDSSKEASWLLDARRWTEADDLATINVFVYKDPVDLAYSFWKRGHDVMFWRSQFLLYYRRILGVGLPFLTVDLNQLLASPETKVEQVCRVLGIPHRQGKERFWEKDHHIAFGNLGVRRQAQAGRSIFEPRREYPPEFARRIDDVREAIAVEPELQELLAILDRSEVANQPADAGRRQSFDISSPYPAWYYRQRVKRFWFRRFPRTADADVREAAATVPGGGAS